MGAITDILGNIGTVIGNFFDDVTTAFGTSIEALKDFIDELESFKDQLIAMSEAAANGEMYDLPIYQSIGMVRYVTGETAFRLMYVMIAFGCLMTIFQLVMLLYQAWKNVTKSATGTASTSVASTIGTKLINFIK